MELEARAGEDGWTQLDDSDFDRWTAGSGMAQAALMDDLALHLAREFDAKRLSFAFCDSVVNDLWAVLVGRLAKGADIPWPNTYDEIYGAFDAGEFHRRADPADVDPVEKYTRPAIRRILGEQAR
jgi:hypothetical protein